MSAQDCLPLRSSESSLSWLGVGLLEDGKPGGGAPAEVCAPEAENDGGWDRKSLVWPPSPKPEFKATSP